MEAIIILLFWLWILSAYIDLRLTYFNFIQYASVSGPNVSINVFMSLLTGPMGMLASMTIVSGEVTKESFKFRPKSPNPPKAAYVSVLGKELMFRDNLGEWNRFRKLLLILPWDKVEEEPLSRLDIITRDRIRKDQGLKEGVDY